MEDQRREFLDAAIDGEALVLERHQLAGHDTVERPEEGTQQVFRGLGDRRQPAGAIGNLLQQIDIGIARQRDGMHRDVVRRQLWRQLIGDALARGAVRGGLLAARLTQVDHAIGEQNDLTRPLAIDARIGAFGGGTQARLEIGVLLVIVQPPFQPAGRLFPARIDRAQRQQGLHLLTEAPQPRTRALRQQGDQQVERTGAQIGRVVVLHAAGDIDRHAQVRHNVARRATGSIRVTRDIPGHERHLLSLFACRLICRLTHRLAHRLADRGVLR